MGGGRGNGRVWEEGGAMVGMGIGGVVITLLETKGMGNSKVEGSGLGTRMRVVWGQGRGWSGDREEGGLGTGMWYIP